MTLRDRCDDTNTEIIVAKEGMREQDRVKERMEVMIESWGKR